jgi:hypothetical protein
MSNALVERRKCPRYRCQNNGAGLDGWQGGEAVQTHARLIDIGQRGISVVSVRTLPTSGTVWLSLGEPTPTFWIGAEVVWQDASNRAGLAFLNDSSLDVFHAATLAYGFENLFGP